MRVMLDAAEVVKSAPEALTWRGLAQLAGHSRQVKAEEYLTALVTEVLTSGSARTRMQMAAALVVDQDAEVRDRVAAAGPLHAAKLSTRGAPDLLLVDQAGEARMVVENKGATTPSQARLVGPILAAGDYDRRVLSTAQLQEHAATDSTLWQLDAAIALSAGYLPEGVRVVDPRELVAVYWTGHRVKTACSAYPGSYLAHLWKTARHRHTLAELNRLLDAGLIDAVDVPAVELVAGMLTVPWSGRWHPDAQRPLLR